MLERLETLVGSLVVMVMFSGYENFVSRIDVKGGTDKWRSRTTRSSVA